MPGPHATTSAIVDVDRLVHEPARLTLLSHLYTLEAADFVYLLRHTGLTQGNLSSHLSRLEAAGYVDLTKGFAGKRPRTMVALTPKGREAFEGYLRTMREALGTIGSRT